MYTITMNLLLKMEFSEHCKTNYCYNVIKIIVFTALSGFCHVKSVTVSYLRPIILYLSNKEFTNYDIYEIEGTTRTISIS